MSPVGLGRQGVGRVYSGYGNCVHSWRGMVCDDGFMLVPCGSVLAVTQEEGSPAMGLQEGT